MADNPFSTQPWGLATCFGVLFRPHATMCCARPPFALERLHALGSTPSLASPESRLIYRFPKPDIHGRTELLLTPLELLDALAKFVPPPRVHRHRYHGVLAPNARLRPHAVAFGRPELVSKEPAAEGNVASPSPAAEPAPAPASPARAERPPRVARSAAPRLPRDDRGSPHRGDRRSIRWAVLLARIYDVLAQGQGTTELLGPVPRRGVRIHRSWRCTA